MRGRASINMQWQVFRNTKLVAGKTFFRRIVHDADFNRVLGTDPQRNRSRTQRLLAKAFWFWPRIEDARGWAAASTSTRWNPEQYLHTHRTLLIDKVLEYTRPTDSLMELGCNCGSDMAQLHDEGYRDLCGVDASGSALELFANEYPQVFQVADIRHDLFQRYLMNCATNAVDYVYSNGATIELVHPSFPVVSEICRVARCGVLLDLSEHNQGYPRDYVAQFRKAGLTLVYSNNAEFPENKSHIFVFTRDGLEGIES